jgi:hypothetical protein
MRSVYLAKHGRGFLPADDESTAIHRRMEPGEAALFRPMRVRDLKSHRRYWKLMTMCAENCERIEIRPGTWIEVRSKDDVHTAIKLCTGYYDTVFDAEGRPAALLPRSTSFDEMTAEEWLEYWPRVLDVVQHQVLPGVQIDSVELEILKCMGMAA